MVFGYSSGDWHSDLWFHSNITTSWAWEAAEICLSRGQDGKNRLGKLNTEGLCWSCAQAEDADPVGATEDATAAVQPWLCCEHRAHPQCL